MDLRERMYGWEYETKKRTDAALRSIVWHLPRRLVMWAAVRVMAHATTGEHANTIVPELTCLQALDRWPTK